MRPSLASLAIIGLLVGCGNDATAEPNTDPPASAAAAGAIESIAAVPTALDFTAPLVDGTELDVRQFAGEPVVFWFWSPY